MNYDWQLLKMLFYFILIIIMIVIFAKVMRKFLVSRGNGQYINIVESLYINQKNSLSLVKIKDKIFLLGVGSDQIQKLAEWNEEEFGEIEVEDIENYSGKFKDILKKNWRDRNG